MTVDTQLPPEERAALLEEVRYYLPAFLSSAATERPDVGTDSAELLNLSKGDLRRVTAVHVMLSDSVRAFVASLRAGLRQPMSASTRPRVLSPSIRGPVDWGATIRERATKGVSAPAYVIRPAIRLFDSPENRALAWLLRRLRTEADRATRGPAGSIGGDGSWLRAIQQMRGQLEHAARVHWLRDIPPERPSGFVWNRLAATRKSFYANHVTQAARTVQRYTESPSPADLADLLGARFFEHAEDWRLFETVVALRLERAFRAVAAHRRKARMLIGSGRTPYARFMFRDGSQIKLWYQAWPHSAGPSAYNDARGRYSLAGTDVRPDLVIEHVTPAETSSILLLELKASRSSSYLASGIFQMLGYLKDRPAAFTRAPYAWLVAPAGGPFTTVSAGDGELWVVSADEVATAATRHFFPASQV